MKLKMYYVNVDSNNEFWWLKNKILPVSVEIDRNYVTATVTFKNGHSKKLYFSRSALGSILFQNRSDANLALQKYRAIDHEKKKPNSQET